MDATQKPQVNQLEQFIDALVTQRFSGEPDITDEIRDELKKDAYERFANLLINRTYEAFSDQDAEVFDQLVAQNKPIAELDEFTKTHITDYPNVLTNVIEEFQKVYLEE